MTSIELREYESLSDEGKEFYQLYRKRHPEWNHEQLMMQVSICLMDPFGDDNKPSISFREIVEEVLKKARDYINREFPRIYEKIKAKFAMVLEKINTLCSLTWEKIVDFFS